jgi:hypothetical protein
VSGRISEKGPQSLKRVCQKTKTMDKLSEPKRSMAADSPRSPKLLQGALARLEMLLFCEEPHHEEFSKRYTQE